MSTRGKVTLITGASRGVGRALALGFAGQGAMVVAAARTMRALPGGPEGSPEETVRQITDAGGRAVAIPFDVAHEGQVKALVERTLAEVGPIDVLINNAGILLEGPINRFDFAELDRVVAVNLRGTFLMCRHVLPGMIERRLGSVINITSRAAIQDSLESLAYGPSKAALDRFTLNLALDMRPYNIAVNSLGPDNLASALDPGGDPWKNRYGRVRLPPEELIPAASWLAQQDASTFTGHIVYREDFGKTWP